MRSPVSMLMLPLITQPARSLVQPTAQSFSEAAGQERQAQFADSIVDAFETALGALAPGARVRNRLLAAGEHVHSEAAMAGNDLCRCRPLVDADQDHGWVQ